MAIKHIYAISVDKQISNECYSTLGDAQVFVQSRLDNAKSFYEEIKGFKWLYFFNHYHEIEIHELTVKQ